MTLAKYNIIVCKCPSSRYRTNSVCAILTDEKMTNTPIPICVSLNINLLSAKVQWVLFLANGAKLHDFHLPVQLVSVLLVICCIFSSELANDFPLISLLVLCILLCPIFEDKYHLYWVNYMLTWHTLLLGGSKNSGNCKEGDTAELISFAH